MFKMGNGLVWRQWAPLPLRLVMGPRLFLFGKRLLDVGIDVFQGFLGLLDLGL